MDLFFGGTPFSFHPSSILLLEFHLLAWVRQWGPHPRRVAWWTGKSPCSWEVCADSCQTRPGQDFGEFNPLDFDEFKAQLSWSPVTFPASEHYPVPCCSGLSTKWPVSTLPDICFSPEFKLPQKQVSLPPKWAKEKHPKMPPQSFSLFLSPTSIPPPRPHHLSINTFRGWRQSWKGEVISLGARPSLISSLAALTASTEHFERGPVPSAGDRERIRKLSHTDLHSRPVEDTKQWSIPGQGRGQGDERDHRLRRVKKGFRETLGKRREDCICPSMWRQKSRQ